MTKKLVVEFMLNLCNYRSTINLANTALLDPAGGDGIFLISAIERLHQSSVHFQFDFSKALKNLQTVEINKEIAKSLADRIAKRLLEFGVSDYDKSSIVSNEDFLRTNTSTKFDVIIGNPPYIRYDNIDEAERQWYRKSFRLFRHRSDVYVAFFEKSFRHLSQNGVLCFICPDRWLKSQYGGPLRDFVAENYGVPVVVGLDGTSPFEEQVYGYPMVVLISTDKAPQTKYYEVNSLDELRRLSERMGLESTPEDHEVTPLILEKPVVGEIWHFAGKTDYRARGLKSIEDQGFKIGIGVATGADSIFIGRGLGNTVESELLVPIILSKDVGQGKVKWSGNYVINPFRKDGSELVNLRQYPLAEKYFESHRQGLMKRHIAQKRKSQWYRTIDKIDSDLTHRPKLLLPDINKNRVIGFDIGEYYPHHNVYYVTNSNPKDLKALGALMMSDLFAEQLNRASVMMHGGYPRRQSQNLRRILLPEVQKLSVDTRVELASLFEEGNIRLINAAILKMEQRL
jgi:hypothetical protein